LALVLGVKGKERGADEDGWIWSGQRHRDFEVGAMIHDDGRVTSEQAEAWEISMPFLK
jgi:hypothetical protein